MPRCTLPLVATLLLIVVTGTALGSEPTISLLPDASQPKVVDVSGFAPATLQWLAKNEATWPNVLQVRVAEAKASETIPSIAGSYALDEGHLRFKPRFSFRAGLAYRVTLALPNESSGGPTLSRDFLVPAPAPAKPTRVTAVYPSADVLPENQLKFYLHFSAPMGRGEVYEHVQLLRENGEAVDLPFLEIGEELWDRSGRRLTLLIDPGRIKQGVKPREDIGPALEAGKRFTLVIDPAWRDAKGQPLAAPFKKQFSVGPPISVAIDRKAWRIEPPAKGTREPLVVRFPRPLDRALLKRTLSVTDPSGATIAGKVEIADAERRWEFRPELPWQAGEHHLVVDTVLEDLAGNRIGSPFEVDQLRPLDRKVEASTVRIGVTIE